jgi:hypothetical protein
LEITIGDKETFTELYDEIQNVCNSAMMSKKAKSTIEYLGLNFHGFLY